MSYYSKQNRILFLMLLSELLFQVACGEKLPPKYIDVKGCKVLNYHSTFSSFSRGIKGTSPISVKPTIDNHFIRSISKGDLKAAKCLLEKVEDIDMRDDTVGTALHMAKIWKL